jgi:endonuclease/exonuclease/phosphatase family metal-dependent hydrolase
MGEIGLNRALPRGTGTPRPTFPSLVPVFALDRIYTRGLECLSTFVPRGAAWARMSDHLPLVAEFQPA